MSDEPRAGAMTAITGEPMPPKRIPVNGRPIRLRWPWAPVIRERAAWIMSSGQPVPDRTRDIGFAVRFMTVLLAALALYGAYVRYVIAKGH